MEEIESYLERIHSSKIRAQLLEGMIEIFKTKDLEEKEFKVQAWKQNVEQLMATIQRQKAEYLTTLDSAPFA